MGAVAIFIWIITGCWTFFYGAALIYAFIYLPERFGFAFKPTVVTVVLFSASIAALYV